MRKPAQVLSKVEAARKASRILRAMSFWVDPSWGIDAATQQSIVAVAKARSPQASNQKIDNFLEAASQSVVDFQASRASGASTKRAHDKIDAVAKGAEMLAKAWAELSADRNLLLAVKSHLSGQMGGQRKRTATETLTQRARVSAMDEILSDGLPGLIGELRPLAEILNADRTRGDPFGHWFVFRLSQAWMELTGEPPSLTRNTDAVSGRQTSGFQELLDALALLPPIGAGIVRDSVEAFKYSVKGKP
jgi:hypothetical protein